MNRVDAQDRIEARVREWQDFRRAQMQAADAFGLAVHQGVGRDVQAERLKTRAFLHKILDEKAFGAADVQNAHARFEPIAIDYVAGNGPPAAVITITAIA